MAFRYTIDTPQVLDGSHFCHSELGCRAIVHLLGIESNLADSGFLLLCSRSSIGAEYGWSLRKPDSVQIFIAVLI